MQDLRLRKIILLDVIILVPIKNTAKCYYYNNIRIERMINENLFYCFLLGVVNFYVVYNELSASRLDDIFIHLKLYKYTYHVVL